MLRNQISEGAATYEEPYLGVNLRDSEENLQPYEARLMSNCEYYGGTRIRRGSQRLTPASLGAFRILGGGKHYYGGAAPTGKRLIAYNGNISTIAVSYTHLTLPTSDLV